MSLLEKLEDAQTILFLGDTHGDDSRIREAYYQAELLSGVDVVIQLGDFGFWHGREGAVFLDIVSETATEAGIPFFFIDGNHENFDLLLDIPLDSDGLRPIRENLTHLPRGFRWSSSGWSFLALGGATSVDADRRVLGKSLWTQESLTEEDVQKAVSGGHADFMLTHDCPTGTNIPGISHRKYVDYFSHAELDRAWDHRDILRGVIDVVQPLELFHGHFHVSYDGFIPHENASHVTVVRGLADNNSILSESIYVKRLVRIEV